MKEIERKFLVKGPVPEGLAGEPIRQGYITAATDSAEVRLRRKGRACFLTVKSEGGLVRDEYEIAIGAAEFETLWPLTEGRRVEKTRYTGQLADGLEFELDIFEGHLAPLMLVEVEFPSEEVAHGFAPPDWFGEDVTGDKAYRNRTLALSQPA